MLLLLKLDCLSRSSRKDPYLASSQRLCLLRCFALGRRAAGLSGLASFRGKPGLQSWAVYKVEAGVKLKTLALQETAAEKVFGSLLASRGK